MVHELLELLPPQTGSLVLGVAIGGVAGGLVLWLAGSRISRGLITLLLVAAGALIGLRLPGLLGWQIDRMGPAVAVALILGLSGFVLHRAWVGGGLGLTLGIWTAVACWVAWHEPIADPIWTTADPQLAIKDWATAAWAAQPDILQRVLPWATAAAALSGIVMALLWPRLGGALFYSLVGVSMITGLGMLLVQTRQPAWLDRLPQQTWIQLSVLAAMVATGMAVQWCAAPRPRPAIDAQPDETDA